MMRYNGSTRLFLSISRLFNSNVKLGESKHTRPVYRIFYDLRRIHFKMLSFVEAAERLLDSNACYLLVLLFQIFILQLVIYHSDLPACMFIQTQVFIIRGYFISN